MLKHAFLLLPFVLLTASGCAQLTHFNDVENMDPNSLVLMDAKQRGVFYWERLDPKDATKKIKGYCAEPSPDAMSALAATLGVDLSLSATEKLGVSQTISEGVSNIGIRTVAIQALRDIMYRNCEAFAIGGVTAFGIETLQRRFQSTMVAILAIEQLTGAVKAPPIVITSEASIGAAEESLKATELAQKARLALESSEKVEATKKSEYDEQTKVVEAETTKSSEFDDKVKVLEKKMADGDSLTQDEQTFLAKKEESKNEIESKLKLEIDAQTALKTSLDSLSASTKENKDAYEIAEAARKAVLTGTGASSNAAQIASAMQSTTHSDEIVQTLANAVTKIVSETTNLSYYNEVCTTLIGLHPNESPNKGSALANCNAMLFAESNSDIREKLFIGAVEESYPGAFYFGDVDGEIQQNNEGTGVDVSGVFSNEEIFVGDSVTGSSIKKIQKTLNESGFTDSENQKLDEDGIFGRATRSALRKVGEECKDTMEISLPKVSNKNISVVLQYIRDCKSSQ